MWNKVFWNSSIQYVVTDFLPILTLFLAIVKSIDSFQLIVVKFDFSSLNKKVSWRSIFLNTHCTVFLFYKSSSKTTLDLILATDEESVKGF